MRLKTIKYDKLQTRDTTRTLKKKCLCYQVSYNYNDDCNNNNNT